MFCIYILQTVWIVIVNILVIITIQKCKRDAFKVMLDHQSGSLKLIQNAINSIPKRGSGRYLQVLYRAYMPNSSSREASDFPV